MLKQSASIVCFALLFAVLSASALPQVMHAHFQTLGSASGSSHPIHDYTLPPDKLQKAHALYLTGVWLFLATGLYSLVLAFVYLRRGWVAKLRSWAERLSTRRFLQALVVVPVFVVSLSLFLLPAEIYGQHVERKYGLSIQGWPSWLRDWAVALALLALVSTVLAWILYAIIRRSPRRWWLYFWLAFLPISAFLTFIAPVAIDPLFNHYEPLAAKDPALVQELEKVAERGGLHIPPTRMFAMKASEKLTGSNAYVTGFGATRRIVVWDTAIQKLTTPEIAFVFGHEMGHYVLGHILKGFAFMSAVFLVIFYLGYRLATWLAFRWGTRWDVRGLDDWASLPLFWLVFSLMLFFSSPALNAFSRHLEHQADQYGLEVVHGLIPDSSQVAAQSFQKLGEEWLEYPHLNKFVVWWLWDHPPIPDRIRFALSYDSWSAGKSPAFVRRSQATPQP